MRRKFLHHLRIGTQVRMQLPHPFTRLMDGRIRVQETLGSCGINIPAPGSPKHRPMERFFLLGLGDGVFRYAFVGMHDANAFRRAPQCLSQLFRQSSESRTQFGLPSPAVLIQQPYQGLSASCRQCGAVEARRHRASTGSRFHREVE
jgi:hypothetical protein